MQFRRYSPRIFLISGIILLILIIKYQNVIRDVWLFNLGKFRIYFDNFFYETSSGPRRHRPLSLLERETELKLYIGEPFRNFSQRDWNKFWNLIYSAFPRETPERQGLPKRMRQLTLDEIASELMLLYPQPFTYFKESHWNTFFGIVLKK